MALTTENSRIQFLSKAKRFEIHSGDCALDKGSTARQQCKRLSIQAA